MYIQSPVNLSFAAVAACLFLLPACEQQAPDRPPEDGSIEPPNPAAQFCVDQGGEYLLDEGQCQLEDGTVVDAWEYFREHGPADES